jgi:hypothetical protein
MACEECRELTTHVFRSPDDLLHAVRLATEEVDRGVLARVDERRLTPAEQQALDSSLDSGAMPDALRLRFRCQVCGALFTLHADTQTGAGGWTREGDDTVQR